MEILLSGFVRHYDATTSVEAAKRLQQDDAHRRASAGNTRTHEDPLSRKESNQRTPPNTNSEKIINGEVLSSEAQRGNTKSKDINDNNVYQFTKSSNQQASSDQPDNRRIPKRLALQTFQDNEELISFQHIPKQISGLIDEYV